MERSYLITYDSVELDMTIKALEDTVNDLLKKADSIEEAMKDAVPDYESIYRRDAKYLSKLAQQLDRRNVI